MADASACRIGHDSQRTGWHPASRVRFAGLRPPLTPAASSNTTESTHSKFKRGMNYMDYVDDAAMVMFTPEQVARMHSTLNGPRSSLVS